MRETELCRNCGLEVRKLLDPWGGEHGWYHPTIEREDNVDGMDVMIPATFCPDDLGEAEPTEGSMIESAILNASDCFHAPSNMAEAENHCPLCGFMILPNEVIYESALGFYVHRDCFVARQEGR